MIRTIYLSGNPDPNTGGGGSPPPPPTPFNLTIQENGVTVTTNANTLNFLTPLDITGGGSLVNISAPPPFTGITILENGTEFTTDVTTLDFVNPSFFLSDVSGKPDLVRISNNFTVKENGVTVSSNIASINFTSPLDVTGSGTNLTITSTGSGTDTAAFPLSLTVTAANQTIFNTPVGTLDVIEFSLNGVSAPFTFNVGLQQITYTGSVAIALTDSVSAIRRRVV